MPREEGEMVSSPRLAPRRRRLAAAASAGLAVLAAGAAQAQTAPKVALVVGESAYGGRLGALSNPGADADGVTRALQAAGFAVTEKKDLDRKHLLIALSNFQAEAAEADYAVFYFAGHGLQVNGRNYLLPIGADPRTEQDLAAQAVSQDTVLRQTSVANKLNLLIFDSCRNNPLAGTIQVSGGQAGAKTRGLAPVDVTGYAATFVEYAARDGQEALDGANGHSPFAAALISHLAEPGLEVSQLLGKVRLEVLKATGQTQTPSTYGEFPDQPLYLIPPARVAPPPRIVQAPPDPKAGDHTAWSAALASGDPDHFRAYLILYPNGDYAAAARGKLAAAGPVNAKDAGASVASLLSQGDAAKAHGDLDAAFAAYDAAQKSGSVRGAYLAGWVLDQGTRTRARDPVNAARYYRAAAQAGDASAQNQMGYLYDTGNGGVERDPAEAMRWFRLADAQNYATAAYNIGQFYRYGKGVPASAANSHAWYVRAAKEGYAKAQVIVGDDLAKGVGVAADPSTAATWYASAARQGYADGLQRLGALALSVKDYPDALEALDGAASAGSALAQNQLGDMYYKGLGVTQDRGRAFGLFLKAARQNLATAEVTVAVMYLNGVGVDQDRAQAFAWLQRAAQANSAMGQYDLAVLYATGRGTARDMDQARAWMEKAADQGYDHARAWLDANPEQTEDGDDE